MKKLFAILSFLVPLIAFGDLLPEPGILTNKENSDLIVLEESWLNNDNTIDNENNIDSTTITIDEKDGIVEEDEFDPLSNVAFWFCDKELENTTYSFNWIWEEWKPIEVCLIFQNLSDRDISIDTSLYTTDYDDIWMIACTQDKSLSNFITSGNLWIITIPAENYLIRTFEITFPIWFSWEQNWCFGYRAPSEWEVEWVEFFVRKVFLMKFFIWSVDIKNELTAKNLTTKLDDNWDLILSFWVENIWNMENTFDIQWNVKWLFGYNKKFESSDTAQLAPSRSQYFELNLWSLPSYGWKFDI